jgi:hypothetical protein
MVLACTYPIALSGLYAVATSSLSKATNQLFVRNCTPTTAVHSIKNESLLFRIQLDTKYQLYRLAEVLACNLASVTLAVVVVTTLLEAGLRVVEMRCHAMQIPTHTGVVLRILLELRQ